MPEIDSEYLTLQNAWLLTLCLTVATCILYILLRPKLLLGLRALMTWKAESVHALHDEHGKFKVVFCTFLFGFGAYHVLNLLAVWIGVIMWTFGFFEVVPG